jgi:AcrR family transcriptional regulator
LTKKINLAPRREPQQQRSRQMREDILTAAIRVLQREGALRATTPRVAEAAGVSVGSLYQYFPNKQALIFAVHQRAVERAWVEVQQTLDHPRWNARQKIARIAGQFFVVESEEVREMGPALDVEVFFADQPEYRAMNEQVLRRFVRFVRAALPGSSPSRVEFSARFLIAVLESVGRATARLGLPKRQVVRWARHCAEMVCDHLGL